MSILDYTFILTAIGWGVSMNAIFTNPPPSTKVIAIFMAVSCGFTMAGIIVISAF
jgi:hypothetical protein